MSICKILRFAIDYKAMTLDWSVAFNIKVETCMTHEDGTFIESIYINVYHIYSQAKFGIKIAIQAVSIHCRTYLV